MIKTISINGKDVAFKTDGAFPRFYRSEVKSDILVDMQKLNGVDVVADGGTEVMENVAFAMAKYADKDSDITIEEWLSQFGTFDLVGALPEIIQLWTEETATFSTAKKKNEQQ